jgi:tetratricopeptide (TPR) repeat protein
LDAATAETLLAFAESTGPTVRAPAPDGKAALDAIDERSTELVAAIGWFAEAGRADEALRLANALYAFWITKQRFDDGWAAYDRALAASGGAPNLRARASIDAGFMPFWTGDDERATAAFQRGLDIAREIDETRLVSRGLGGLIRVALRADVAEARRLGREALAYSDAAGNIDGRSDALHLLGVGAQIAGDLPEARDWMRQRLALVREQGNEALIASEAGNLSMVERQLGDLDESEALVREALEIADRRGDEFMKPFALSGFAAIATERGEDRRAATLVGAAEAIMEAQNMAWPPDERPHYERMLAVLPERMGSVEFERARAAGRSMPTAEAVTFALGAPVAKSNRDLTGNVSR